MESRISQSKPFTNNRPWPQHVCLSRDKLIGAGAGAERVLIEQAKALIRRGIDCSVVVYELTDTLGEQLPNEVNIHVLGERRYDELLFVRKLLKLKHVMTKLKPDCVIAHQTTHDYLRWALSGTGIPYFLLKWISIFYLGYDTTKYSFLYRNSFDRVRQSMTAYKEGVPRFWKADNILRRLINESYALRDWLGARGAREVFAMTSQSQWEMEQLYGIKPIIWTPGSDQSSPIPVANESIIRGLRQRYGIEDNEPIILSVNRLEYRKRVEAVVKGFALMSSENVTPKLVIVGQGEEQANLVHIVRDMGLYDRVIFAGHVSEEELPQHYHMCDVAVSVIWGSWALAVIEPLLYNKRLLISNEIPDLLSDVPNLFRVEPSPSDIAKGLEQALRSPVLNSFDALAPQVNWDNQMETLISHMQPTSTG